MMNLVFLLSALTLISFSRSFIITSFTNKRILSISSKSDISSSKLKAFNFWKGPNAKAPSRNAKVVTSKVKQSIDLFRKEHPKPRKGSAYEVEDNILVDQFYALKDIVKNEDIVCEIVKASPDVLIFKENVCKDNFAIYESKWGFEKAVGLITRNPNLLCVATTGYGSAEKAGDDTMVASYVIAYTRPIGAPLLALLFTLLSKPFIEMFLQSSGSL